MAVGSDVAKFHWERLPPMPVAKVYTTAAYRNQKLYVIGGCTIEGKALDTGDMFDMVKKEWTKMPPAPHKRAGCIDPVFIGEKLVLIGGTDEKQSPLAAIDVYNTETDTWEEFPPLPNEGRIKPIVQLVGNRLFVMSGAAPDRIGETDAQYLDLVSMEWVSIPPMKDRRYTAGSHVHKNKLYVVGGRTEKKAVDTCEILDLEKLQWEKMSPLPKTLIFYSVVGLGSDIFMMGGMAPPNHVSKKVYRYRIEEDMWETARDMLCLRTDFAAGVVCGRIVVAGGLGFTEESGSGLSESEALTGNKKKWEKLPNMLKSRLALTSTCWERNMAVVGGLGEGGPVAVAEILTVDD